MVPGLELIGTLFEDWRIFALMALTISTILTAIVYMIGSILLNEKIKTWAKMELTEIFYSVVIVAIAASLIPLVNGIVEEALDVSGSPPQTYVRVLTPTGVEEQYLNICDMSAGSPLNNQESYQHIDSCHSRLAVYYLRTVFDEGRKLGNDILLTYSWTSIGGETSITIQTLFEKQGVIMWSPWKGLFTLRNQLMEMVFNWNITVLFLTKFQEILIVFVSVAAFPVLFVAGVLLRTFTFTRRLGGLLMGIALALYFIYPAFYALGGLIMIDMKEKARVYLDWEDHPANVDNTKNPPIINTIFVNMTENRTVGGITVLEDYDQYRAEQERLSVMSAEEREQAIAESLDTGFDFDLGDTDAVDESEKENLLIRAAKWGWDFISYYSTHNFILGASHEWRDNGFIDNVARLTFFSTFFAVFGILGTIAATRSLAATFGGDIELAGLTRLI